MLQVLNEIKTGKAPGPSDASMQLTADSEEEGNQVMVEIFHNPR